MRGKRKMNWGKLEGEMKHERLWTQRNKLRVLEGWGVGRWVSPVSSIFWYQLSPDL